VQFLKRYNTRETPEINLSLCTSYRIEDRRSSEDCPKILVVERHRIKRRSFSRF